MDGDVKRLTTDSGELTGITGLTSPGDRFTALAFTFASATLRMHCDDDTDEILVEVVEHDPGYPSVSSGSLGNLVGMRLEYAWALTNHRGYSDAFQLRFTDGRGRDETRQFEVAASAMDVRRLVE